jgi:membrane associated rhomboid family serine protease
MPPRGPQVSRRVSGFGRSRITPIAMWILFVQVGAFLVYVFSGDQTKADLVSALLLTGDSLKQGHVWKVVTTTLLTLDGFSLLLDALMLWLFIPSLEGWWGSKRFLVFFAATSLAGNLVAGLVGMAVGPSVIVSGIQPFIYASIAAFGVIFGNQQVQFFGVLPMKGRVFAIGMCVVLGLFVLLGRQWVHGAGYAAAMVLAWAMTSGKFTPHLWWLKWRHARLRKRYTVLEGGLSDDKKRRWMN